MAEAVGYDLWVSTIEIDPVDCLGIIVLENEILVVEDLGGALPLPSSPDFNPPILVNPSNITGPLPYP